MHEIIKSHDVYILFSLPKQYNIRIVSRSYVSHSALCVSFMLYGINFQNPQTIYHVQLIRFDEAFRIRLLSHVENWICARQTLWHLAYGCMFVKIVLFSLNCYGKRYTI